MASGLAEPGPECGSACRSERIAKYNRLIEIEAELGGAAVFGNPLKRLS